MLQLHDLIVKFLSLATLGIYNDLSHLIPHKADPVSNFIAWLVILARFAVAGTAIFLVARKISDRFGLSPLVPIAITAIALVGAVAITHPWTVAENLSLRLGGFQQAITDPATVSYTPSAFKTQPMSLLFKGAYESVGFFGTAMSKLRNVTGAQVKIPDLNNNYKIELVAVSFSWLYYLLAFAFIFLTFWLAKQLSRKLAVVIAMAEFALVFGISPHLVATIAVVALLAVLAYYLIAKGYGIFAVYPVVLAVLTVMAMFSWPKSILVIVLGVLMYLTLIPLFYLVGWVISGLGELVEMREKIVKVKPKKVIEEQAVAWDEVAMAVVLSGLFMLSIALYGTTLIGLGTFLALSVFLLK